MDSGASTYVAELLPSLCHAADGEKKEGEEGEKKEGEEEEEEEEEYEEPEVHEVYTITYSPDNSGSFLLTLSGKAAGKLWLCSFDEPDKPLPVHPTIASAPTTYFK